MANAPLMLELNHIRKTFNKGTINEKPALLGVTLKLNPGDFCTVIGGNGAGKSTCLNAIAGVWPVDGGSIIVDGENITGLPEYKRAEFLGRVFQDPMNGTAATMQIIYHEQLKTLELGLEDRMTQKVGLLSGGQRQALTLLMATLKKPKLLLLDEHTAALDPKTAEKVLRLTDEVVKRDSLTALMVTHNMRDAIRMGNRLIMMNEGRIVYEVSGEEKKHLQVSDLLEKFSDVSHGQFANDRMMLA